MGSFHLNIQWGLKNLDVLFDCSSMPLESHKLSDNTANTAKENSLLVFMSEIKINLLHRKNQIFCFFMLKCGKNY